MFSRNFAKIWFTKIFLFVKVFAKVFAKIFAFSKVFSKFFYFCESIRKNKNFRQSFHLRVKGKFFAQVTTIILYFNVNFSACLWQLSHLF
jgi:hypothetical protein